MKVQFYDFSWWTGVSLWHGFRFWWEERTEKIVADDLDFLLSPCRFGNKWHFINKYFFGHRGGVGQKYDRNFHPGKKNMLFYPYTEKRWFCRICWNIPLNQTICPYTDDQGAVSRIYLLLGKSRRYTRCWRHIAESHNRVQKKRQQRLRIRTTGMRNRWCKTSPRCGALTTNS